MDGAMKKIFLAFILLIIVIGWVSFNFSCAEDIEVEGGKSISPYLGRAVNKDCMDNFSIDRAKSPKYRHKALQYEYLLDEYYICRAGLTDSIRECDNLKNWPSEFNTCKDYYNEYHNFYGRVVKNADVNAELLSICSKDMGISRSDCVGWIRMLIAGDSRDCDKATNKDMCRALASGDTKWCSGKGKKQCRKLVLYVKAVREWDIKTCGKIKDPKVRAMCRGAVSSNAKNCEKNRRFKSFASKFCTESIKKGDDADE